ncbi:MAG: hypothetical protein IM600_02685 [Bacteroidetes bacterium]|jgi:hypothetical protein|nr:hypothetical protein [Bacteroidota bacterium]MCA6442312.1 hypothetical protein [Bacteroidota bacterium]
MKTLLSIVAICISIHFTNAQSFTELAFQACKTTVDTSESIERLKPCQETFSRLLKGSPQDSMVIFYYMLTNIKLSYLTLPNDRFTAKMYLSDTKSTYLKLDSAFQFGIESKMLWKFGTCIALKSINGDVDEEAILENEINEIYLKNKQNARANLLYAFYNFHFKRNQRAKITEQQLITSIELFKREEALKPSICWGQSLAKKLLRDLKSK